MAFHPSVLRYTSLKNAVSQVTVPMMLLPQQSYPVILSNYPLLPLQSYIFLIGSRMSLKIIFVQTGIQTRSSNHLWAALSLSVWSDHLPAFICCHWLRKWSLLSCQMPHVVDLAVCFLMGSFSSCLPFLLPDAKWKFALKAWLDSRSIWLARMPQRWLCPMVPLTWWIPPGQQPVFSRAALENIFINVF